MINTATLSESKYRPSEYSALTPFSLKEHMQPCHEPSAHPMSTLLRGIGIFTSLPNKTLPMHNSTRIQLFRYNSTIIHLYQIATRPDRTEAYNSTKLQFSWNTAPQKHLYPMTTLPDCNSTRKQLSRYNSIIIHLPEFNSTIIHFSTRLELHQIEQKLTTLPNYNSL